MGIHASNAAANSSSFLRTRVLGLLPCVLFKVKMFGGPMCGVASNSMRREQQRYFNRMADSLRREEANMRSESKASVEECQENMNWSDRVLSSIRSWASQRGLALARGVRTLLHEQGG